MANPFRTRLEIEVFPHDELTARPRLLGALERAYAVRFVPYGTTSAPTAVLALGADPPSLPDVPTLSFSGPGRQGAARTAVEFRSDPRVPAPFRGRTFADDAGEASPLDSVDGAAVLAALGRDAVWATVSGRALFQRAGGMPPELATGERLRDRLRPGRYIGLLPLVNFLQTLTGSTPSHLQACFVIDDPNLHALRYGYIAYPTLAQHAETHGYHAAMAMIPLDAWFASRKAVALFSARRAQLSLLVHGNDHVRGELARARSAEEATATGVQALRRIESFERRTGVDVSRVVVPPHSASSALGARGLLRAGFAALCTTPAPHAPDGDVSLREWYKADFVAGGLPNISRHHLGSSRDDLPFRAFLGQPLVIYLHHDDLRGGLDVLAEAAGDVERCGVVEWMSVGDLAERQFSLTVEDDTAVARLFARRARIQLPEGVTTVAVELPGHDEWQRETLELTHSGRAGVLEAEFQDGWAEIEAPGAREVVATLRHADTLSAGAAPMLRTGAWPMLRRLLTEGRDRLTPKLP